MSFQGLEYQANGSKEPIWRDDRLTYRSAPEITWSSAATSWERANNEINNRINRRNGGVIVLSPHSGDVTSALYRSLSEKPLGQKEVPIIIENPHPDNEILMLLQNEQKKMESVYIVASFSDPYDWNRARAIADHCKTDLRIPFVTLFASYMATREDKNIDRERHYRPNAINIRSEIKSSAIIFDRMFVIEPHSSATQYFAAQEGIPLVPLTPWQFLTDDLLNKGVLISGQQERIRPTPLNAIIVRPDTGRNIAAKRISEYTGIPSVCFEKRRITGSHVEITPLNKKEAEKVKGKIAMLYDDEASTVDTMRTIAEALEKNGAIAMAACLVHCKFTGDWYNNISHKLITTVIGTDSRTPIGNIDMVNNIEIISLAPLIRRIIKADMKGINFWNDQSFQSMILQQNGENDS